MIGLIIDPETGDLLVKEGALAIGETTEQVAWSVLVAARGEFKEFPLVGGEIHGLLNGNVDPLWAANAKQALQACGVPASRVVLTNNQVTIE